MVKGNNVIVIANGFANIYELDDKNIWTVGRPTENDNSDIEIKVKTVSRKHGILKNIDGIWFYIDDDNKNGTTVNGKQVKTGMGGRKRPVMLSDGDTLIFGGRGEHVINEKTGWMYFTNINYGNEIQKIDTKDLKHIIFDLSGKKEEFNSPSIGTVVRSKDGIGIYMGDITFLIGKISISLAS